MIKKTADKLSGAWFVLVGALAAFVHIAVFEFLRRLSSPEWANAGGFLIGFAVSYWGHRRFSFKDARTSTIQSLLRFAITAMVSFATNEICFMTLVYGWHWPVLHALVLSMLVAAGQTFVLSRWWAFRR